MYLLNVLLNVFIFLATLRAWQNRISWASLGFGGITLPVLGRHKRRPAKNQNTRAIVDQNLNEGYDKTLWGLSNVCTAKLTAYPDTCREGLLHGGAFKS